MNPLHRLCVVSVAAVALVAGVMAPAYAAAPSNDGPGRAKVASGIGYTDSVNVSRATSGRLDPTNCSNNASVWYKFRASTTETINVNTTGSNYRTTIGVYTGKPGAFTAVRCVVWTAFPQAALDLKVKAGTTYYFMIGAYSWPRNGRDGQDFKKQPLLLQFNMRTPLRIDQLAAADAGTVDQADGDAHVTVTHQCNYATEREWVEARLRQRVGDTFVAKGFTWRRADCGTDTPLTFAPRGDIAFVPGPATVTVLMQVCARETGNCKWRRITEEVVLAYPVAPE